MKHLRFLDVKGRESRLNYKPWMICLCFLLILLTVGFGPTIRRIYQTSDQTVPQMSYIEARELLTRLWENKEPNFRDEKYDQHKITFIGKDKIELYEKSSWISSGRSYAGFGQYNLAVMSDPYVKGKYTFNYDFFAVCVDNGFSISGSGINTEWSSRSDAEAFVNALYVLKQYATKEKKKLAREVSSFPDFQEKAKAWRALSVKPSLPENVKRCKLLAEDAYNSKEFEKAIDYYEQGLEIEPLWPDGQYNVAFLYGEINEYEIAAHHMKRYLELVPNAPDAQSARDQIIIWQSKIK